MLDPSHATLDTAVISAAASLPEEGAATMFCTQCGTKNGSDARFCKQCGHRMERATPLRISEEEFKLPEGPDEKVRGLLILAYQKYEAGDLDAAVAACSGAIDIRPESTDAHSLMSTLYEKKGDRDRAIAERERVLELNPGSIADREKLDELKDGRVTITPRKITTSRRSAVAPLIESPVAQAFAAVFVMLVVLLTGVGMMWAARNGKTASAAAGTLTSGAPVPGSGAAGPTQSPQQVAQPLSGQGQIANPNVQQTPTWQHNVAQAPGRQAPPPGDSTSLMTPPASTGRTGSSLPDIPLSQRQDRSSRAEEPLRTRALGPAPVASQPDQDGSRLGRGALPEGGERVILPETGPDAAPGMLNGGTQNAAAGQPGGGITIDGNSGIAGNRGNAARTPNPPQGKIEIIVSNGTSGTRGAEAPKRESGADSSLDSRSALEIARDNHNRGQYAKAVPAYKRALDGAGDGAADIHQKIALCYYRLGEKTNAITHYQHAIEAYKSQMSAGRNVDAAKSAIRACENGIKVCQ